MDNNTEISKDGYRIGDLILRWDMKTGEKYVLRCVEISSTRYGVFGWNAEDQHLEHETK